MSQSVTPALVLDVRGDEIARSGVKSNVFDGRRGRSQGLVFPFVTTILAGKGAPGSLVGNGPDRCLPWSVNVAIVFPRLRDVRSRVVVGDSPNRGHPSQGDRRRNSADHRRGARAHLGEFAVVGVVPVAG